MHSLLIRIIFGTPIRRSVYLFGLSLLLTVLFLGFFSTSAYKVVSIKSTSASNASAENKTTSLEDILGDLSPLIKIPVSLLEFDIWAKNNIWATGSNGEMISTLLNIDVFNKYKGDIPSGEKAKITKAGLANLDGFVFTYSVKVGPQNVPAAEPLDRDKFTVYIWPTISALIITWLVFIAALHGLTVLITTWVRFIAFGVPIFKEK